MNESDSIRDRLGKLEVHTARLEVHAENHTEHLAKISKTLDMLAGVRDEQVALRRDIARNETAIRTFNDDLDLVRREVTTLDKRTSSLQTWGAARWWAISTIALAVWAIVQFVLPLFIK